MNRFEDKVVLVTGAARGIGRATALRLAREGATLLLADRDEAALKQTVQDCGAGAIPLIYDASDLDSSRNMATSALSAMGKIDALICNAGIYRRAHFEDVTAAEWSLVMDVNLNSPMQIVQALLPALVESRGNVTFTASTAGLHGIAYAAAYACAKAGIVALTKSLSVEYAGRGVRFNAICPGRVRTDIGAGLVPLHDEDAAILVRPPKLLGKMHGGEADDIAGAFAFLASADAAYVSGAVLTIDGAQNVG